MQATKRKDNKEPHQWIGLLQSKDVEYICEELFQI
jgi:hypothetical protein